LYRLGGLTAVLGGSLMALDLLAHLLVHDTLAPSTLAGLPHELWHVPGIVALPLVLLGLVAIYVAQAHRTGRLGLWGFVLLVFGVTVGAIYSTVFHGLFMPAIEGIESGLFETLVDSTTAAQFYRGVVVQGLGLGLGAALFGIATIRGGVFPPVGGWLLIGAALFAATNQVFPPGQLISRGLFAIAFVWLGAALRRPLPPDVAG
jgi:hypothetical protein